MSTVINTTFQLKRGTSEAWTRNNPKLYPGEPGFELDTGKLKIGDGIKFWRDLPYITNDVLSQVYTKQQVNELLQQMGGTGESLWGSF